MPQIQELLVLHHTHTDIGYTHPQPVLWELQRRFIDQALDCCERAADWDDASRFRWTCECTAPLRHWMERAPSKQVDRFRSCVEAGLIGGAAMAFHPCATVTAPQLARLFRDAPMLRQRLGLPMRCAIGHDINGLPWPTVGMLRDVQVELLIMGINIVFGGYPLRRPMAFKWRGPDDREVLVFNGEHYAAFDRELRVFEQSTQSMADGLKAYLDRAIGRDYPHDFAFLTATHPYFSDNNPPDFATAQLVRQWNQEGREPRIRYVTPEGLLHRLLADAHKLPTHRGDWTDYWSFGVASSTPDLRAQRHAKHRLDAAKLLVAVDGPARADTHERLIEAERQLDLYDEHTWGCAGWTTQPYREVAFEQWSHKSHLAWQGRSLVSLVMRDQLEHHAGNEIEGVGARGVLLFNPAPVARRAVVRVPRAWLSGGGAAAAKQTEEGRASGSLRWLWQHFSSNVHRIGSEGLALDDHNSALVGPFDVPACGVSIVPAEQLVPAPKAAEVDHGPGWLQSPYFRLEFDTNTGRITGLIDRATGRQLVDATSPWGFFGFVRETVDETKIDPALRYRGRELMMDMNWDHLHLNQPGWQADWPALREGPGELRSWEVRHDAAGVTLVLRLVAPGTSGLEQRITLPAHRAVVECEAIVNKLEQLTPESVYFAMPLAIAPWRAHFDTADVPVELDAQQLPGVCRDYQTVGRWVNVSGEGVSVTVACPDAPMVMVGGFHFGKTQPSVSRDDSALLLLWPANNYWMTNFRPAQPGGITVRYEVSVSERFEALRCVQAGQAAIHEVEAHPVLRCEGASRRSLVEVTGEGVALLSVEPEADGSVTAWVANVGAGRAEAGVGLAGGGGMARAELAPGEVRSVRLKG